MAQIIKSKSKSKRAMTMKTRSIIITITIIILFIQNISCNCDSEIYCRGPILEKIQMSRIFADSKQFVDMPTSKSKAVVKL